VSEGVSERVSEYMWFQREREREREKGEGEREERGGMDKERLRDARGHPSVLCTWWNEEIMQVLALLRDLRL
jgi:hypothetical protein